MLFLLWPSHFILSGTISVNNCPPLFPSSILDTFQPSGFTFQCHVFLPFHTFHGVLTQEYLSGLPFPPRVGHILSELFTMTHLSWVALHGMAHSFIELQKPLFHDNTVIHEGEALFTDHLIYSLPSQTPIKLVPLGLI